MGTSVCVHGALEAVTASWSTTSVPAAPAVGVASARTWWMASAATARGASLGCTVR